MLTNIKIKDRVIGDGHTYIIAEMGASHCQSFSRAASLVHAAKEAGADAIKLQTYTPECLTIDCDKEPFQLKHPLWKGQTLYELYSKIAMPWSWQPKLKDIADRIGITLFSTPFSVEAVDFLEAEVRPLVYKVASYEINHIKLLERIKETGKPVFVSTGTAEGYPEITQALKFFGKKNCVMFYCVSKYPTPPEDVNLRTIAAISQCSGTHAGFSDHSEGIAIPVAAVALDARVIEKHIRSDNYSDAELNKDYKFSITPSQFEKMVDSIRQIDKAVGGVRYASDSVDRAYKRSCWFVQDVPKRAEITENDIAVIRPCGGAEPRDIGKFIGKRARKNIDRGTPATLELVEKGK